MEPGAWKDLTEDLDFASGLCCVLGVLGGASVCGFVQLSSQKKAVQFLVAGAAALSRVATF
jgi:hypothetical protein